MEFNEKYIWVGVAIAVIFFLKLFGKGRGGVVVSHFTADLQILDPRFQACRPDADYCIFKEGKPHKIEIEVENLPLQEGDVLDFYINQKPLARVPVKRDLEAEFEHWSDGDVNFPEIKEGDKVDIIYQGHVIMTGVFREKT